MGSNGLDLKNAEIRRNSAGLWGDASRREPGRGQKRPSEPKRWPPTPPLGRSPFRRGDHKGQSPAHAEATIQPPARGAGVPQAAAGGREGPASPPSPAVPPSAATHHFPSGRRRPVAVGSLGAPLRMARQPPPFLPWLAPGSAVPT